VIHANGELAVKGNNDNGFVMWWDWFSATMRKPVFRFNFWVYLIVGVVGAGGLGVWVSFMSRVEALPNTLLALLTFYPATAVASCMEFIFEDSDKKFVKGFAIISGFVLFLLSVFVWLLSSYLLAILACILSLTLWWLANAENPKLSDTTDSTSPIGGAVDNDVKGTPGDLKI